MDYANPEVFAKFAVNRPGQIEAIRQPLYDLQAYPAAGATSLTFFAVPNGQSSKTLSDTNMETAGSLPNPKRFLVLGISLQFFPEQFSRVPQVRRLELIPSLTMFGKSFRQLRTLNFSLVRSRTFKRRFICSRRRLGFPVLPECPTHQQRARICSRARRTLPHPEHRSR